MLNIPLQPIVLAFMVLAERKPQEAVRAPTKFAAIRFRVMQVLPCKAAMELPIWVVETTAPVAVGEAMAILAAAAEAATTVALELEVPAAEVVATFV